MPVKCDLRNGKWVVVDDKGNISGEHETEGQCNRQARAINANIEMGQANIIITPKDCDFVLAEENDPLVFEKEHAYVGKFHDAKNNFSFELTEETLQHFANETNRYIENGNKSNLPVEHTTDPEKNRGANERFFVKQDSKGRLGLFSRVRFRDLEAAKLAKTSQTSIFAPPSHKDGLGNEYVRPIRHSALTDYPVVPGLDGFTPIAASLVIPNKELKMTLKDLAGEIGLQLSEGISDEEIQKGIISSVKEKDAKIKEKDDALKLSQQEFEAYKKANPPKQDPVKVSQAQIQMLQENRELKLSTLVEKGHITPAVRKGLEEIFCAKPQLELCLSEDQEDGFNKIVEILKENDPIKLGENTGPQSDKGVSLLLSENTNPVMKVANRMAEAAK